MDIYRVIRTIPKKPWQSWGNKSLSSPSMQQETFHLHNILHFTSLLFNNLNANLLPPNTSIFSKLTIRNSTIQHKLKQSIASIVIKNKLNTQHNMYNCPKENKSRPGLICSYYDT
ncbi:hypothetical protein Hanom_Chr06g00542891 [Helianthus anomalus]